MSHVDPCAVRSRAYRIKDGSRRIKDGFSHHHIGPTSPSSPNQDVFALSNCPFELLNLI